MNRKVRNKMENRMEEAKKIVENMDQNSDLAKLEGMVRDNKIEFLYNEKEYRVRLLNQREKE